jgi:hypothetical protein
VDALERPHHPTERIVDPLNTFTSRVKRTSLDLGTYDITELEIFHQKQFAYLEKNTGAEKSYLVFENTGFAPLRIVSAPMSRLAHISSSATTGGLELLWPRG